MSLLMWGFLLMFLGCQKSALKQAPVLETEGAIRKDMVRVAPGTFIFGDEERALEAFLMDQFEVSNARYRNVVSGHLFSPGAERHPASWVTWPEAKTYCEKIGKHLPSEMEWEKAARGPKGRRYPWGNKKLRKRAHPTISGMIKQSVGFNKKDRSAYGARGMASSVWEWTTGTEGDKKIVRGGLWNEHLDYDYSLTTDRFALSPEQRFIFVGFRCAK